MVAYGEAMPYWNGLERINRPQIRGEVVPLRLHRFLAWPEILAAFLPHSAHRTSLRDAMEGLPSNF